MFKNSNLLNAILKLTEDTIDDRCTMFSSAKTPFEILESWLQLYPLPKNICNKRQLLSLISSQISLIDDMVDSQLNHIIHNETFQELETRWRGLRFIVDEAQKGEHVIIKLLDITWEEIYKDVTSLEFDQSQLFNKIYEKEFGTPGGYPFGILLGDYYVHIQGGQSAKDLSTLSSMAEVSSSSFCPFIVGLHPNSIETNSFAELHLFDGLTKLFSQPQFNRWNNFRQNMNSKFIGITIPRLLFRKPYLNEVSMELDFCFNENTNEINHINYLWGNGCFAFGLAIIRSFNESSWFEGIKGVKTTEAHKTDGIISQLPSINHRVDKTLTETKYSTEIFIDENDESLLSDLGFIAFTTDKKTGHALLLNSMSTFKTSSALKQTDTNSKISATLQYIFCASRFAHYIKIIGRDKVGSLLDKTELLKYISNWAINYVATNDVIDETLKAKFPLQGIKIDIEDIPGKPGCFHCIMRLQPRYQLEKVSTALTLVTELAEIQSN
jgi:type VI secretion system protein ImpD